MTDARDDGSIPSGSALRRDEDIVPSGAASVASIRQVVREVLSELLPGAGSSVSAATSMSGGG